MKIDFTREQYKLLINMIYAGNILINGFRDKQEINRGYEKLEYYIYSYAKEFGCEDYVEYDNEFKEHFPTSKFDKHMRDKIHEYDDYVYKSRLLTDVVKRVDLE